MLLGKNKSCLDFFQEIRNPVRKKKVYRAMIVIQNSAIKCYHEIHVRSHNNSKMLILVVLFILLIFCGPSHKPLHYQVW